MRLYLVRHGDAKPKTEDPERGLSETGVREAEKVAAFLASAGIEVNAIWQSGKARARQTAEILAKGMGVPDSVSPHPGLSPMDPVQPIAAEIEKTENDLMVVGHLPFMNRLASLLIANSDTADTVIFRQASTVCLERDVAGTWRIGWMVTPDLLP